MQIIPLFDRVLIKPQKPKTTTKSGLTLTTKEDTMYKSGIVLSTGDGNLDNNQKVDIKLKVGDNVIFDEYTATKITMEDSEYYLIKQIDILAIIKE